MLSSCAVGAISCLLAAGVAHDYYEIQARILEGGQVRFINTQPYPVITQGQPKAINVIVKPVHH